MSAKCLHLGKKAFQNTKAHWELRWKFACGKTFHRKETLSDPILWFGRLMGGIWKYRQAIHGKQQKSMIVRICSLSSHFGSNSPSVQQLLWLCKIYIAYMRGFRQFLVIIWWYFREAFNEKWPDVAIFVPRFYSSKFFLIGFRTGQDGSWEGMTSCHKGLWLLINCLGHYGGFPMLLKEIYIDWSVFFS